MKFIEKNKHRHIEKSTMELAMSWYYRYLEKEEQLEKIDNMLCDFQEQMDEFMVKGDTVSVAELQKAWDKTIHF